jgi:hypothetical protein
MSALGLRGILTTNVVGGDGISDIALPRRLPLPEVWEAARLARQARGRVELK